MPSLMNIDVDTRKAVSLLEGAHGFVRSRITKRFSALGRRIRDDIRSDLPRRSGRAARAVYARLARKRTRADVTMIIGGDLRKAPHLAVLEHGALIRPRRAQKLAIPLGRARTARGVGRFSARALERNPTAFGYERSFVRSDVVIGVRPSGRTDALFALVSQVILPRGNYFRTAAREWRMRAIDEGRTAVREGLKLNVRANG